MSGHSAPGRNGRGRLLLSFIPPALVSVMAGWATVTNGWARLGVPNDGVNYGDLRVIPIAATCAATDPAWNLGSPPCTAGMSHYNYPSVWAKAFAALGLFESSTSVVAITLMVLFLVALWGLAYLALPVRRPGVATMLLAGCAVSPPVLLAMQRGNIDLMVFALLVLSAALLISRHAAGAAVALALATVLKLFPIGSAAIWLVDRPRDRRAIALYCALTLAGLSLIVADLPLITARTPQLDGASFGAGLLPLAVLTYTDLAGAVTLAKAIGILIFALGLATLALVLRRMGDRWASLSRDIATDRTAAVLLTVGAGAFLVAYLAGPSFDYRLLTLVLVIAALARIGTRLGDVLAAMFLVQLVLSYSTFIGAAQYLSDLMLLVLAPLLLLLVIAVARSRSAAVVLAHAQDRDLGVVE